MEQPLFIFDAPYVSDVAEAFVTASRVPLLENAFTRASVSKAANLISEAEAVRRLKKQNFRWVYTNSENAIAWIAKTFGPESEWLRRIDFFKNKHVFRQATADLFPEITVLRVSAEEIDTLTFERIGVPFVIKPVVGFISAGVFRVNNASEWRRVREKIRQATTAAAGAFPAEVLSGDAFLIESVIEGEEYAVDAYFDDDNRPVVLNILHHRFEDDHDMSDRLYVTSPEIMAGLLPPIERFLSDIAGLGDFRGLPIHAEVRVDSAGRVRPIEINPLRFAGWCSTDIALYAYGVNVYEYFAARKKPDWERILEEKEAAYAMAVIERPCPLTAHQTFDYDALEGEFENLVTLRKIDYRRFPILAFAFFRVGPGTHGELARIQALDPAAFVKEKRIRKIV